MSDTKPRMYEKIAAIKFQILESEKAAALSSVQIKTRQLYDELMIPSEGGPLDKRLGSQSQEPCTVCGDKETCPGHFGHIQLPLPVFHPGFVKHTMRVLNCLCMFCGSLLSEKRLSFKAFLKECMKIKSCPRCHKEREMVRCDKNLKVTAGSHEISPITAFKLLSILTKRDCERLSLKQKPCHLLMSALPVLPNVARPSVRSGMKSAEDDITLGVSAVAGSADGLVKAIERGCSHIEVSSLNHAIQESCSGIISSNESRGLIQRLRGKHGRFRGTLSGKRVDHTARTVISPDPRLPLGCVGVPKALLSILTFPETVNPLNIDCLQKLVNRRVYPSAVSIQRGDVLQSIKFSKKADLFIKEGDIVHRHLRKGDVVLLNRQPSLHRLSILAHEVVPSNSSTISFNECVCAPFNADFDGDEMNLHIPQDIQAVAEARILMPVSQNLCTPRNGEPLVAATQDFVTAMHSITALGNFMDRKTFSNLCCSFGELPHIRPCFLRPAELFSGKQVFNVLLQAALWQDIDDKFLMSNIGTENSNKVHCDSVYPQTDPNSQNSESFEPQFFSGNTSVDQTGCSGTNHQNNLVSDSKLHEIDPYNVPDSETGRGHKPDTLDEKSSCKPVINTGRSKKSTPEKVLRTGGFHYGVNPKCETMNPRVSSPSCEILFNRNTNNKDSIHCSVPRIYSTYNQALAFFNHKVSNKKVFDTQIVIHKGQYLAGQINKQIIGSENKKTSLVSALIEISPKCAIKLLNSIAKLSSTYLTNKGFSLGLNDVEPTADILFSKEKTVLEIYEKCEEKLSLFYNNQLDIMPGCTMLQSLESTLSALLSQIRDTLGNECVKKRTAPTVMQDAGSKGSKINVAQMVACVGQQIISGKRICDGFSMNPESENNFTYRRLTNLERDEVLSGNAAPTALTCEDSKREMVSTKVFFESRSVIDNIGADEMNLGNLRNPQPLNANDPGNALKDTVNGRINSNSLNSIEETDHAEPNIHRDDITCENRVICNDSKIHKPSNAVSQQSTENQRNFGPVSDLKPPGIVNSNAATDCSKRNQILPQTRTLPHFHAHNALTPIAKGFVKNSFYSGLTPTEFFFHAASGREGLVDTAVKTAETGYMQRRLMKALEDLRTLYDKTIRNSHNEIVQFHSDSEPGTADGALAAQSIGEPGTQMTLKTFHFAGVASMNITLGVPRIKEIINATRNINTPLIKAELACHKDYNDIMSTKNKRILKKLERRSVETPNLNLPLKDYTATVSLNVNPNDTCTAGSRNTKESDIIDPPNFESPITAKNQNLGETDVSRLHDSIFPDKSPIQDLKLVNNLESRKPTNYAQSFQENVLSPLIFAQTVKAKIEKTYLRDVTTLLTETYGTREIYIVLDIDFTVIQQLLIFVTMESIKKDIHNQHKVPLDHISSTKNQITIIIKKDYFAFKSFKRKVLSTVICGIQSINRCVVNQEKNKDYTLVIEGAGLHPVLATPGIKTATTNSILEIADVLGIEAARQSIINEITYTMDNHGITIYKKHVELLADTMTFRGLTLGITRHGISKMKSSTLMLASFEQTADHLFDAAVKNTVDEVKGVSECIILGKPMNVGTGMTSLIFNPAVLRF